MSFGDLPDQLPGDYDLACGDSFEACDLSREEMWREWQAAELLIQRLTRERDALLAQQRKMPPMPPTPSDISW